MNKKLPNKTPFEVDLKTYKEVLAEWRKKRIDEMRRLSMEFNWTYEDIAKLYGITRQQVGQFLAKEV